MSESRARIQILLTGLLWSALAAISFVLHHTLRGWICAAIAGVLLVSAAAVPSLARGIHKVLAFLLVTAVHTLSLILLGLIYFLVIAPAGLFLRLTGSLQTTTRPDPSLPTYWIARPREPLSRERYHRTF
ncbi:MAG: hypothetical protein HY716_01465 [Planctomycetes bacterium]|nr:hypothetical protein [Planctomycetota bacterium]